MFRIIHVFNRFWEEKYLNNGLVCQPNVMATVFIFLQNIGLRKVTEKVFCHD